MCINTAQYSTDSMDHARVLLSRRLVLLVGRVCLRVFCGGSCDGDRGRGRGRA